VSLVLRIAIFIQIAVLVATFANFIIQYNLLEAIRGGEFSSRTEMLAAANAGDTRVRFLAALAFPALAFAVVALLFWVYRVTANAHARGAEGLSASAGLAVAYFFIPFANIVMPGKVLSEVERAGRSPSNWRQLKTWMVIPLWWATWIIMNLAGLALSRLPIGPGIDALEQFVAINIGYKVLELIAYALTLVVAVRITRLQRQSSIDVEAFA